MLKKYDVLCVLLFFLIGLLSGCSGPSGPPGMPPLHPTTVIITQGGQPLASATVSAICAEDSQWSATGVTDSQGRARLFVYGQHNGVPAGSFKILVTKIEEAASPEAAPLGPEPDPRADRLAWLQWEQERTRRVPARAPDSFDVVEIIYSKAATTPLSIDVIKGRNEFTFDVGSAVQVRRAR